MILIRYNLSIAIIEMTSAKEIFVNENLTIAKVGIVKINDMALNYILRHPRYSMEAKSDTDLCRNLRK